MNKLVLLVLSTILLSTPVMMLSGCSNEAPPEESGLAELISKLADKHGVYNPDIAKEIQKRGAEAIPPLLEAAFDTQNAQEQLIYAHVLVRIDVEPDRFEAIKKLIEHPNLTVQTRAVDALTRLGHPEKAVDLAIELTKDEEKLVRYTAYRALRFSGYPKRMREVCSVLRRGLNDPEQEVRETAQRSIDHLRDERRIVCP
jgi:hypothetical protein